MPTDPVLASARHLVDESLGELRASIEGLPVEAVNWRPAGDETNSIAVLATHTVHSTRMWLTIAVGAALHERDRDSEFRVSADDPAALLRLVEALSKDCSDALRSAEEVDWSVPREVPGLGGDTATQATAAFALIHATAHLRGHVDQMALTRHLWEQRGLAT